MDNFVRMFLGFDSRVLDPLHFDIQAKLDANRCDHLRDLHHSKDIRYLIDDVILAWFRRGDDQSCDTLHCVSQRDVASCLMTTAVDRQRHANHRLSDKAIDHGAPPFIDVKPSIEVCMSG